MPQAYTPRPARPAIWSPRPRLADQRSTREVFMRKATRYAIIIMFAGSGQLSAQPNSGERQRNFVRQPL